MLRDQRILNPALLAGVAAAGHTHLVVVCDAGLPLPRGVQVLDLSLVPGVPRFDQTVAAVRAAMVVESAVVARESRDGQIASTLQRLLSDLRVDLVAHEDFKALTREAHLIVRTGECTPYANVALVAGVPF
jgi:D-ribose pyranase